MSSFSNRLKRLSFRSVRWPVKLLAKPSVLPEKAIEDLDIDLQQPVYYVLSQYSATDLNLLQQVCKQQGLPLPLAAGNKSGYIFILKKRHFWNRDAYYNRHHEKIKILLERQASSDKINIQFIPVTVRWGRNPGKEPSLIRLFFSGTVRSLGFFQKAMALIFFGRSTLVTFGRPIDISTILGRDSSADHRSLTFARHLRVYFHNQKTASLGPNLYDRRTLIKDLVDQPSVQKAIEQESRKKKIPITKARKNAMSYAWEISGNFSYFMLRVMEKLLGLILRKIYDGVDVNHADRLREMARDNELVYVPCHRSHMDYLLVSYVLFHQGLVPPHIAAGINLNFWPVGAMLRQGGAFFLRRSFSGNKLYSAVFNEYLTTLFNRGYSVEYFPEGGRSRTGRLLPPKTGMLSMTLENVIRGRKKPLLFVPVYIGYDKIMEGKSYLGELRGGSKQSESMGQLLGARKTLKQSYGQVHVNFGQPISIAKWLDERRPEWRDLSSDDDERPVWFTNEVKTFADQIMRGINSSAAVSPMTLVAIIILCTPRSAIDKSDLLRQLDLYLGILREIPYSDCVTIPEGDAEDMLQAALELNAVQVAKQQMGDIVFATDESSILMTYYRNNILHLFTLPALVACCFRYNRQIRLDDLKASCQMIYPYIRNELFLRWDSEHFEDAVNECVEFLIDKNLLFERDGYLYRPEKQTPESRQFILLSEILQNMLKRYSIVFTLLMRNERAKQRFTRRELETNSQKLAERLAILYDINAPEAFDKNVFSTLVSLLREQGAITTTEDGKLVMGEQVRTLHRTILGLLPYTVENQLQQFIQLTEQ